MKTTLTYSETLFGCDRTSRITALELVEQPDGDDVVFWQRNAKLSSQKESFTGFFLVSAEIPECCLENVTVTRLNGDAPLCKMATSHSWKSLLSVVKKVKETCKTQGLPTDKHLFFIHDPVQQHLLLTGKTLFKDMTFNDVNRLQLDIETYCDPAFDFCNAARESDHIILITLSDQTGWTKTISNLELDEKNMLKELVKTIVARDPDVIEGHNIFNFDLNYIVQRAKLHRVKFGIGRDGSTPKARSSRWSAAEKTASYTRYDVFGRHIIDTYFLVQLYDVSHRSMESYSLKSAAIHFGIAPENRTYIEGAKIAQTFKDDPALVIRYATDDIIETRRLSDMLSPTYFAQAQLLPISYQNVVVRGAATKINSLMLRAYLTKAESVPTPCPAIRFEGGYTDMFVQGVARNIKHVDVRSLYPSLILAYDIVPASDSLGIFAQLLEQLRTFRLRCKEAASQAEKEEEAVYFNALQSTFKILINSFYGYLAFEQGLFNDYDAAQTITAKGRKLLHAMIDRVRELGGTPIEIDTDGVYFVPPAEKEYSEADFQARFREILPEGIEVEFDGSYQTMFSYKMKNYALLDRQNRVTIKGAALKSRGLEPFQRTFLKTVLRMILEERAEDIPAYYEKMVAIIQNRSGSIRDLAKTETLQTDPKTYRSKQESGKRNRSAAYELALQYPDKYRAGDQISYYVTGTAKNVRVFSSARLIAEHNPEEPDENVDYYTAKLTALYKKFCPPDVIQKHEDTSDAQQLTLF